MANQNKKTDKTPTTKEVEGVTSVTENTETVEETTEEVATETVEEVNPTVLRQQKAKELRAKASKEVAKQKELAKKQEEAANPTSATPKKQIDNRPTFKDDRGLEFRFKINAPKTLNIDGVSRKITDIIKDEDLMLELTSGNNNLIEQIY